MWLTISVNITAKQLADIWIFGYGSLIFRADFPFVARQPATLKHWSRRFWQASTDHRGTPEYPGRVVTLTSDPNQICWGMAYQIESSQADSVLDHLDYREKGGYQRLDAKIQLTNGAAINAITYLADETNPEFLGETHLSAMAKQIHFAVGPSGKNIDYLFSLEDSLREHGIADAHVFDLAEAVRKLRQ